MRRVVDTSAWIEWLIGSSTGLRVADKIPSVDSWVVPTLVQLELDVWLRRELSRQKAETVLAYSNTCQVAPLTSDVALLAAEMRRRHQLATADAVIYATALDAGADLLTCDAHFDGLAKVLYVGKALE